jgi:RND family efflux transporter MFP subunit
MRGLFSRWIVVTALALFATACEQKSEDVPVPIRPVLSIIAETGSGQALGFAGVVEPRYEAELGFQVLGRMIARDVNVGDLVSEGQRLAALDPISAELAVEIAESDLASAEAQLANALASEGRVQTLLQDKTATEADFEAAQQARESAQSAKESAEANLAKAREQLSYTVLNANFGGVVTAVGAEVGQTVSAGAAVVTIARPDIREAVVDVPETAEALVRKGAKFNVALQIDPTFSVEGTVREVAPDADAATRTWRARITLDNPPRNFRIGSTIMATAVATQSNAIRLPASAIVDQGDKTLVWVVDTKSGTVATQSVKLAYRQADFATIAEGIEPGERVVTAGVHSLKEGQKIRIDGEQP